MKRDDRGHCDSHGAGGAGNLGSSPSEHRREEPYGDGPIDSRERAKPGCLAECQGHGQAHHGGGYASEQVAFECSQALLQATTSNTGYPRTLVVTSAHNLGKRFVTASAGGRRARLFSRVVIDCPHLDHACRLTHAQARRGRTITSLPMPHSNRAARTETRLRAGGSAGFGRDHDCLDARIPPRWSRKTRPTRSGCGRCCT